MVFIRQDGMAWNGLINDRMANLEGKQSLSRNVMVRNKTAITFLLLFKLVKLGNVVFS